MTRLGFQDVETPILFVTTENQREISFMTTTTNPFSIFNTIVSSVIQTLGVLAVPARLGDSVRVNPDAFWTKLIILVHSGFKNQELDNSRCVRTQVDDSTSVDAGMLVSNNPFSKRELTIKIFCILIYFHFKTYYIGFTRCSSGIE